MQILYDAKKDLLYLRLDDRKQPIINGRVSEDIVLDLGEHDTEKSNLSRSVPHFGGNGIRWLALTWGRLIPS